MSKLAITGLGIVSTLGVGRKAWDDALAEPEAAKKRAFEPTSEVLSAEEFPGARTAEVWGWDATTWLGEKGHRNFDRLTKFMIAAAKHALEDSGIKRDGEFKAYSPNRVGISSATAYGSLDAITELKRVSELEEPRYINPTRFPNTVINAAAGYVSIWEDLRAPNTTVVDGNCGSLDAVLNAQTHLMHDRGDAFLVGGGEVVSEALYVALSMLGVIPDNREECGLVAGEGACYLMMERTEDAAARGARVWAELCGYGTAFDAPKSEALIVNGSEVSVAAAMQQALDEAGLKASDVDLVCSAGSGFCDIDEPELAGIRKVAGEGTAVVAPKMLIGETFGAAGAFGMSAALSWMHGVPLPALITGTKPAKIDTVLVNAVGFYGNASAVVLRKVVS